MKNLKVQFSNPKKADILIYDKMGSEFLIKYVIFNLKYEILHARFEKFYLSPKIIKDTIKNIIRQSYDSDLKFSTKIYRAYNISLIDSIKPKVLVTFIDNTRFINWIIKVYPNLKCYSVENGIRIMNEDFPEDPEDLKDYYTPNLLCFGFKEINFYKSMNSEIKNYHPVGSLKGSIYKYYLKKNLSKNYDICFISQYRKSIIVGDKHPDIKCALNTLSEYLAQYIKDTNAKVIIASSSNEAEEFEYYNKYFGDQVTYKHSDKENFSVYEAMDSSKLVVSFCSTAAIEAFGWGKKILLCNFSDNPMYDFNISELCNTNIKDYNIFKNKITNLFKINNEDFNERTLNLQKYWMNYNPDYPVNIFLRDRIINNLENDEN